MSEEFEGLVVVCWKSLKVHSTWSLHTEERPSACELCAKTFSCGNNLKMHMKLTLGEGHISGESAGICRCCAKVFSCRKSLKVHVATTYWRKAFCM